MPATAEQILAFNQKMVAQGIIIESNAELIRLADIDTSRTLCRASLLIWRTSTFVVPILIGGLVAAFYRSAPKNEAHIGGVIPNRETFYSLQKETYAQRYEEVASLVETSKLSREAVLEKLRPNRKKKPIDKHKNVPADISQNEYDEVELDDLDGD